MKYRVRVSYEDEAGQSTEMYSQVVEFDPIKEICDVLNKRRRKVRKASIRHSKVNEDVPDIPF